MTTHDMTTHRVPAFALPEPDDLTTVTVAGRPVAVTVLAGQVYAFDDTCTHLRCSLSQGEVEGRTVVCPCHQGVFDIATGAVLSGPPMSALQTYPARFVDGTLELDVTS